MRLYVKYAKIQRYQAKESQQSREKNSFGSVQTGDKHLMSSCDYYIYREDHDFGPVGLSVCLFDGKITDKTPGMFFLMCCKEVTWIINEQIIKGVCSNI